MSPPAADRRMKTSTMLLLNFILHPSEQSLQVCLLQIRYAYSTKGCWIPLAFIYEQANFWWLVGRTKYVIGQATPARVHAIAEKGFLYIQLHNSELICKSYYGANYQVDMEPRLRRAPDLNLDAIARRIAQNASLFSRWSEACVAGWRNKKRSEIPPHPTPPSQSIMISSPSLLWESS